MAGKVSEDHEATIDIAYDSFLREAARVTDATLHAAAAPLQPGVNRWADRFEI